jgi:hypothetical protein
MSLLAIVPLARAFARRLSRLHRLRRRARVALAPLALLVLAPGSLLVPLLLVFGHHLPRNGAIAPVAPAVLDLAPVPQLLRALDEAHGNCEAARALARGQLPPAGAPLFRTTELETALLENPWVVERALGEVDALLAEAAWLAALDPHAALGDRSWEDVRYLLGGIHWYLERAWEAAARSEAARRAHPALAGALGGKPLPDPRRHDQAPEAYDRRSLREYHDLPTFEDLLGRWD